MFLKNIVLLCGLSVIASSCALWPYKKDFDCPVTEGLKCKSLYEISEMADRGLFGPDAQKDGVNSSCECGGHKNEPKRFRAKKTERGSCCNAC